MLHGTIYRAGQGINGDVALIDMESLANPKPESTLSDAVRREILKLDDEHRVIAWLCLAEDMPVEQVARLGHLTVDLTSNILTEAISMLRQKFGRPPLS